MIEHGDRLAVGLSGGKDSLSLLYALAHFRRVAPVEFELAAVTVSLGWGTDLSPAASFCESLGVPHHVEDTNIGKIVFDVRHEGNPCSLCANMRRGALNNAARRLGCNKVALAHHLDDALETLLMNVFFSGRATTFSPSTYLSRKDLTVVRPLVYCTEAMTLDVARTLDLPVIRADCPAAGKTSRQALKRLVSGLRGSNPRIDESILSSMKGLWGAGSGRRQAGG
ncbi:MAG: tRNA 2-thiocytidine biosynthesis protein TtcA [Firmicutes bacterium]|nr:tRNA 2-thiocytidine biosynthesis protein TtcA [Bacillota bacterium]